MNFKLITVAFAGLAMVALSACGPSTGAEPKVGTTPSASVGAAAPSATPSGSSATSSRSLAPGGPVDGQKLATRMVKAMTTSKTVHSVVTVNDTRLGEGDLELGHPPKATMKVSQQGLSIEVVQVGGVMYIKGMPGTTKPWVRLDPKGTDPLSKAMSSMGLDSKSNDPRAVVSMMAGAKVRDLGATEVGGVSARQYSFDVSLSSYGKLLSPQLSKAVKERISGPITFSYWVGEDNLPLKVMTVMKIKGTEQSTVVNYRDWGKSVTIVAPPASQVGKFPGS